MLDAIQVKDAYKKFGKASHPLWKRSTVPVDIGKIVKVAVDHISTSVREAEIFGVLGPNSSGKCWVRR
jgi:ABC-type multidrug transport system ATPase subunit